MVFAGVGWAKPVSTDPRNFKNPKQGMALTALAGPVANLILAYLAMVVWKLLYYWAPVNDATIFLALFLQYLVYLDVSLAVFNLIRCRRWTAAASCWLCCPSASTSA